MNADAVLSRLASYAAEPPPFSPAAYVAARRCLLDALGCAALALRHPACTRPLGPLVPGQSGAVPGRARVPGTALALDPVQAAFNISTLIRWLDYNDTWLAAEWGHPSDNLGALLAVADYLSRTGQRKVTVRELLSLMIRAYEIQGVLAIDNSFNRIGFDHVLRANLATAFDAARVDRIAAWFDDGESLKRLPVDRFVDALVAEKLMKRSSFAMNRGLEPACRNGDFRRGEQQCRHSI